VARLSFALEGMAGVGEVVGYALSELARKRFFPARWAISANLMLERRQKMRF
jgi:hypothetical protein